jgi:hypothetical protein
MSSFNGIAAFQVAATGDPSKPIRYQLWSGWHEVIPYEMTGQANTAAAVVTVDCVDNLTRYTLWTDDWFRVYESTKLLPFQTSSGRVTRLIDEQKNPYGCIPFSFVFYELPVAGLDSVHGLGPFLSELNGGIDVEMSRHGPGRGQLPHANACHLLTETWVGSRSRKRATGFGSCPALRPRKVAHAQARVFAGEARHRRRLDEYHQCHRSRTGSTRHPAYRLSDGSRPAQFAASPWSPSRSPCRTTPLHAASPSAATRMTSSA